MTVLPALAMAGAAPPAIAAPAAAAAGLQRLVGLYASGGEYCLIRERDGELELVYDTSGQADPTFASYAVQPLSALTADTCRLVADGPLGADSAPVAFERDGRGRGVACLVGHKRYARQFFDPEKGLAFRIRPLLSPAELRAGAAQASPPVEPGAFLPSDLVDVASVAATIKLDIRYATTDNFLGMALYDEARAYLVRPAAEALGRVQAELARYGYGLVVHDAYRPWYVTKMFWDATPDKQKMFVANPAHGSRHNRGSAVDVSLYDLTTGRPLPMISDYDEFSLRASPAYPGGTSLERWRRDLLRTLMEAEGFTVYAEEWWHFDYSGWQRYPILNLPFDAIR
jgi:D-alanyl-D-alanine dipeptidase